MKIFELVNKIQVPLTNEEADVLGKFYESQVIYKKELTDREQIVASNLVIKEVLSRHKKDDKIYYRKKERPQESTD